jgi:hypothetical protein
MTRFKKIIVKDQQGRLPSALNSRSWKYIIVVIYYYIKMSVVHEYGINSIRSEEKGFHTLD